jgi:hypothetical protein
MPGPPCEQLGGSGVAEQLPAAQYGVGAVHAMPPPHWPAGEHVSTEVPLQRLAPGVQSPTHCPPTHAWFTQAAPAFCQLPVGLHCCGCCGDCLLHCRSPGVHATQDPFKHAGVAPEQAEPCSCQVAPALSHFCGCRSWHCKLPGTHTRQTPALHTGVLPAHASPRSVQSPAIPHDSG